MRLFLVYCLLSLPLWLAAQQSADCSIDFKETFAQYEYSDLSKLQEQLYYYDGELLCAQIFSESGTLFGQFFRLEGEDWLYVEAESAQRFSPIDTFYQDPQTGACRQSLLAVDFTGLTWGGAYDVQSDKLKSTGYRFAPPELQTADKWTHLKPFYLEGELKGALWSRSGTKPEGKNHVFFLRYDEEYFYYAELPAFGQPLKAGLMKPTKDSTSHVVIVFHPETFEELLFEERVALLEPVGEWILPNADFDSTWVQGPNKALQVHYDNGQLQGWALAYNTPIDTMDYEATLAYFDKGEKLASFQRSNPHIEACKPYAYGDPARGDTVVWHDLESTTCYEGTWTLLDKQKLREPGKPIGQGIIAIEGAVPEALSSQEVQEGLRYLQLQEKGKMRYQEAGSEEWQKGKWVLEVPSKPISQAAENAEYENGPLLLVLKRRKQPDLRYQIYLSYEGLMALLPMKN